MKLLYISTIFIIIISLSSCDVFIKSTESEWNDYNNITDDGTSGFGLGTWKETTGFAVGRYGHTSVIHDKYIYVMGGTVNYETYTNDVQFAEINDNGSITNWQTTTPFANERTDHASCLNNGYIYIIGGYNYSIATDIVYTAVQYGKINNDGTISSWSTTTPLPEELSETECIVNNGYIYVSGFGQLIGSKMYYAQLNSDGSLLGSWQETSTLPVSHFYKKYVVSGDFMYAFGDDSDNSNIELYRAAINSNGTPGTWLAISTSEGYPYGIAEHTFLSYDNYLMILGGFEPGISAKNYIRYVELDSTGGAKKWISSFSDIMPGHISRHSSVMYNRYVYVIGGNSYDPEYSNKVYYTNFNN